MKDGVKSMPVGNTNPDGRGLFQVSEPCQFHIPRNDKRM